jgi:glycine oxidase
MNSQNAGVSIVGGGLIGTAIAWRLAQQGIKVTITDASNLGGEASTAGAGMLAPGSEAAKPSAWLDLGLESLALYPEFLAELLVETEMPVEFRRCGSLVLDAIDSEWAPIDGVRVEPRAEGIFFPDEALVDPVALLRSLRRAGQNLGVTTEHEHIESIEASNHEAVVIAAGAWSSSLRVTCNGAELTLPPAEPVKGHLIGFQMRPGLLGPFLRKGHTYVLQREDGLVIAGSTEERVGFDTSVQTSACNEIHQRATELVPALGAAEPSRRWIGFRPGPELEDGPILQRVEGTNVWLAYGHFRNGILLTPVTAQRISSMIASSIGAVRT